MKTDAYHSSNPADPDVYHDHSDCPTGKQSPRTTADAAPKIVVAVVTA